MTIAFDAATSFATNFTNNGAVFDTTGLPPETVTHTPVGRVRGVFVMVCWDADSDFVSKVTYGNANLAYINFAADPSGEPGRTGIWFLGADIPQGPQTVSIFSTGRTKNAVVVTLTAATDLQVGTSGKVEGDTANPSIALSGMTGASYAVGALYSGQDAVASIAPGTGMSDIAEFDFGSQTCSFIRNTTELASGTNTVAWTVASEDVAAVAVAVQEVASYSISGTVTKSGSPQAGAEVIVGYVDKMTGVLGSVLDRVTTNGSGNWSAKIPNGKVGFAFAQYNNSSIAFDAETNIGISSATTTLSNTHTPVGTPKAVIVLISQNLSSSDLVGTVTYGGVTMTRVNMAVDSAGEPGAAYAYFLGSGIPSGAQTVSVALTAGSSSEKRVYCVTLTANGDTEVVGSALAQGDQANPSISVTRSNKTKPCYNLGALFYGGVAGAAIAPGANFTQIAEANFTSAAQSYSFIRSTAVQRDSNNATINWSATSDDIAGVGLSIAEQSVLLYTAPTAPYLTG